MLLPFELCLSFTINQQPTAFTLDTFTLPEVFNTSDLMFSLALYSESRQSINAEQHNSEHRDGPKTQGHSQSSVLLLRITAAASYFTTNKSLMRNVPPVNVDISKVTCHYIYLL